MRLTCAQLTAVKSADAASRVCRISKRLVTEESPDRFGGIEVMVLFAEHAIDHWHGARLALWNAVAAAVDAIENDRSV